MVTPEELIEQLNLQPLEIEGGFFRRTYTADQQLSPSNQSIASAIYYLITPDNWSSFHKIASDELFHFYYGDPVEMMMLHDSGSGDVVTISNQPGPNFNPQQLVPKNSWQAARLISGGQLALLGTTVTPAFAYDNFIKGDPYQLAEEYSNFKETILRFT